MKLEEAKERCNELIREKHANWIGLTSQEAISTVLQEIEHLQKEKSEYEARWNNTAHELRIFRNECVPKSEIREKIDNRISTVENLLDEMVDKDIGCINISYLSKKEKEEVIAKRNLLIVQKATLIDMKNDLLKEE